MTEAQKERIKGHHWQMVMHLNMEDAGLGHYRCEALGINKIVRTPKKKGKWGLGVVTYKFDGDDREFDTLAECLTEQEKKS